MCGVGAECGVCGHKYKDLWTSIHVYTGIYCCGGVCCVVDWC